TPHEYYHAHPGPADIGLVMEVCEPRIRPNRLIKKRVCARARIPFFWLIDLEGFRVEVYSEPRGNKRAAYRQRYDYRPGESVPLILDDLEIARVPVSELLPKYLAAVPLT